MVLAATARAQGRLEVLDIREGLIRSRVMLAALGDVVAANAARLRELLGVDLDMYKRTEQGLAEFQDLLAAAPALEVLDAYVSSECCLTTRRLLRNEPPFGPLRMYGLAIERDASGADFRAILPELTRHRSLSALYVHTFGETPLPTDEVDLVVDAALAARFETLHFYQCGLTPSAASVLARLLSSPALTDLGFLSDGGTEPLLDGPGYALLADALRGNRTLRKLVLRSVVWLDAAAEVPALFDALTGHASLRSLECSEIVLAAVAGDDYEDLTGAALDAASAVFGHAIGALVAADAPALEKLKISFVDSGTDVLGPLVDALPSNVHLQELRLSHNDLTPMFAEQRLLPAVRANTSLRELYVSVPPEDHALAKAVQHVKLREAARSAAEAAAGNA